MDGIVVVLKKAEDAASVTAQREGVVVAIRSKSGIGGAQLVRQGRAWPKRVTLRLNVKGLESLRMEGGALRFETSRRGPTPHGVALDVPARLLQSNPKEITLAWVDFFRG